MTSGAALAMMVCAQVLLAHTEALWLDELTSFWFSDTTTLLGVTERMLARGDPHPPGYQLLLHLWMQLPGTATSTLGLRLSSILMSVSTAVVLAILVRRVSGNPWAGPLFLVFFLAARCTLFNGTELRSYALQQAAFAVALLARDCLTFRRPHSEASPVVPAFMFLASCVVLGLTHYVGSLIVGCLVVQDLIRAVVGRRGQRPSKALSLAALTGPALALAWLVRAAESGGFKKNLEPPSWESLGYVRWTMGDPHHDSIAVGLLVLTTLWLLQEKIHGNPLFVTRRTGNVLRWSSRTGAMTAVVAFSTLMLISYVKPIMQERNVIVMIPPLLAFAAVAMARLAQGSGLRRATVYLVCAGVLFSGYSRLRVEMAGRERNGEDFWLLVAKARGSILVRDDDMANKLAAAAALSSFERPALHGRDIRYLSSRFGGKQISSRKTLPAQVTIVCPHSCKSRLRKRLLRHVRKAGAKCKLMKGTARRDRAWLCQRAAISDEP